MSEKKKKKLISVVVPVYNEEAVLSETSKRLKQSMETCGYDYEILWVNDGSKDQTLAMARELCEKDKHFKLISFSRNFGHQIAITAGMDFSLGDAVVIIDADLQDPPAVILDMIQKWDEGYEVVYGKRLKRSGETFFKKFTAKVFYRFINMMTEVDMPVDVGDFRLIDRKVVDALKLVNERQRYVRGIIAWLGFKTTAVEYNRDKRFAGETKYPLKKMIKFALDAITSFSYKPLRLATYMGLIVSFFSFVYLLVVLFQGWFTDTTVPGWASSMAVILIFNGIILMILGVIGEYIGRIYDEVKGRPLYLVSYSENLSEKQKGQLLQR
ncbi:MAG: glycosyltransferase family 2 protein [Erysipelotrichaceae bacterium]|jgi:dolichol-phosphate mannosyltransferase|nr:glycosyltransferase family 2 protein [Erysipelotrichaceae bacterium]